MTPKLHHTHLERHTGAQARLLEDHRQRFASEQRVWPAFFTVGLEPASQDKDFLDLLARQVGKADEVTLGLDTFWRLR